MRKHRVHKINEVMKRVLSMLALCFFLVSPKEIGQADAQILIMDDEEFMNSNRATSYTPGIIPVPTQGDQLDWIYTPLGDGLVPLLGLGMAYLMGRKRKNEDE